MFLCRVPDWRQSWQNKNFKHEKDTLCTYLCQTFTKWHFFNSCLCCIRQNYIYCSWTILIYKLLPSWRTGGKKSYAHFNSKIESFFRWKFAKLCRNKNSNCSMSFAVQLTCFVLPNVMTSIYFKQFLSILKENRPKGLETIWRVVNSLKTQ